MNRCDGCKHKDCCVCVPYGCECFELDLEEHDKQIRADAIDELKSDIISKINFEERWLLDCKSNNADTNIAFGALRSFVNDGAEKLKEKKNDNR